MVALRKDVKVGLTIGAIAVSVIGVYAGLSALAGEKPAVAGATLNTTPIDLASKKADSKPAVADITTPRDTGSARNGGASNSGSANPGSAGASGSASAAQPNQPLVAPQAGDGNDPWGVAFGSGNVPPAVTQQPAPGTKGDAANDRKETIEAIQGKSTVATAGDGSGSIASGGRSTLVSGNTTGTAPAAPTGPEKSHTIEPGETLTAIAAEYYGDGNQYAAIIAANPLINPNRLKPGTVIKIPAVTKKEKSDTTDMPATGATTASTASIDPTKQYVVKSGDSLHKIASTLYNDSAVSSKIYDLNKDKIGADPTKIKVGMVLTLPSAPTQVARN